MTTINGVDSSPFVATLSMTVGEEAARHVIVYYLCGCAACIVTIVSSRDKIRNQESNWLIYHDMFTKLRICVELIQKQCKLEQVYVRFWLGLIKVYEYNINDASLYRRA